MKTSPLALGGQKCHNDAIWLLLRLPQDPAVRRGARKERAPGLLLPHGLAGYSYDLTQREQFYRAVNSI